MTSPNGGHMWLNCGHKAYVLIREKAVNFGFAAPGRHIDIRSLADELHLSPIPVREALIRLAQQDLVDCIPKKGFFCKEIKETDITMDYEFMAMTLNYACKNIAKRKSENEIDSMMAFFIANFEKCTIKNKTLHSQLLDTIESFYDGLLMSVDNTQFRRATDQMIGKTHYVRMTDIQLGINNRLYIELFFTSRNSYKDQRCYCN